MDKQHTLKPTIIKLAMIIVVAMAFTGLPQLAFAGCTSELINGQQCWRCCQNGFCQTTC